MELKISKKYKLIEDIHLASGIKYSFYKKIDFPYIHIFRGLTEFQITEVRYPLNVFYHSYVNINNKKAIGVIPIALFFHEKPRKL